MRTRFVANAGYPHLYDCLSCGATVDYAAADRHDAWHNELDTRITNLDISAAQCLTRSLVSSGKKTSGAPKARGRERSEREDRLARRVQAVREYLKQMIDEHEEHMESGSGVDQQGYNRPHARWGICRCDLARHLCALSKAFHS